jgi:Zn ribbon nucleic-acid-binding protein
VDKTVFYDDEQQQRFRECVACGFIEKLEEPPVEPGSGVEKIRLIDR